MIPKLGLSVTGRNFLGGHKGCRGSEAQHGDRGQPQGCLQISLSSAALQPRAESLGACGPWLLPPASPLAFLCPQRVRPGLVARLHARQSRVWHSVCALGGRKDP